MNNLRAKWAEYGLKEYVSQKSHWYCETPETWLGDFLCDLRHYAHREGLDFDKLSRRGEENFKIEQAEKI
jgi:hypothetical protein